MPMADLVLPSHTAELIAEVPPPDRHPGLQLDKLSWGSDQETQGELIDNVTQCSGDNSLLQSLLKRRSAALDDLGALRFQGETVGPMTLHLSRSAALENAGIALHPVYGFAWLPGTGIKGMTRAWAETVWARGESDQTAAWALIRAVFGTSPQSEHGKGWKPAGIVSPKDDSAGRIVFHDAWPVTWPKLERDIVNSHHTKYYQGQDDPGDWETPTIVSFLVVPRGAKFDFPLSDRTQSADGLVELAMEWLRGALMHAGAGAKTAAGYGRMAPVSDRRPGVPDPPVRREYRLTLASPAFLAGANQQREDCDLRPATLRGLMRWWWRTMHARYLAKEELAKLEALVWGSAKTGSAVAIALEPHSQERGPVQYNKNEVWHQRLDKKQGARAIPGLFYASYGMDEKMSKEGKRSRWFRESGDSWNLILTARDGFWGENQRLPASLMMEQAEAALWLLARFGGVGSKSRKGFGSFAGIGVSSVQSVDDCRKAARHLRSECGFVENEASHRRRSSTLEDRIEAEIPTRWTDSWYAIDRLGSVYQEFVKSVKPKKDRLALGLPRQIDGHRQLKGAKGDRHASPVHWSLDRDDSDKLIVRFVAFPASSLPDWKKSQNILTRLKDHVQLELEGEVRSSRSRGRQPRAPMPPKPLSPVPSLPQSGTRIRAVLLEERTKKGGWKAKTVDGTMAGTIVNSTDVPDDCQPHSEVELFVQSAQATSAILWWPSPAAIARFTKSQTSKPAKQRHSGRGSRRR